MIVRVFTFLLKDKDFEFNRILTAAVAKWMNYLGLGLVSRNLNIVIAKVTVGECSIESVSQAYDCNVFFKLLNQNVVKLFRLSTMSFMCVLINSNLFCIIQTSGMYDSGVFLNPVFEFRETNQHT